ncbi:unnamed protein product [Meloidogyne enterolobii]|uniref:Uncharacterized protein n=1 Tax=Meloidogyne enterolobii TaxID=390850 RepID=A0ACB0Z5W5_MELEN
MRVFSFIGKMWNWQNVVTVFFFSFFPLFSSSSCLLTAIIWNSPLPLLFQKKIFSRF